MYQDTDNATALEGDVTTNASTIRAAAEIFTLINVFSVVPDRQQELANLLIDATGHTMRHLPGFISANIHTSFDGRRVVNYAQWRSRDAFEAMLRNPDARPHMTRAAALASFDPIQCEVVHVDRA
jgi:heme-degrading monooxygenase HmoA